MDRAPEFDLALDIDDITGTDSGRRGNPRGVAVTEFAQVDDGQTVHLPDAFTRRIDQQRVTPDRIDGP